MIGLGIALSSAGATLPKPGVVVSTEFGVEVIPGQEIEITAGDALLSITITEPEEFAGTYAVNPQDLASGPVNLYAPRLSGATEIGSTLSLSNGLWLYDAVLGLPTLTRNWQRGGVDIPGQTGMSYTLMPEDEGQAISARETSAQGVGLSTDVTTDSVIGVDTFVETLVSLDRTQRLEQDIAIARDQDEMLFFFSGTLSANNIMIGQNSSTFGRWYLLGGTRLYYRDNIVNQLSSIDIPLQTRVHLLQHWHRVGDSTEVRMYLCQPGDTQWTEMSFNSASHFSLPTNPNKIILFGDATIASFTGDVARLAIWAGDTVPDVTNPEIRDGLLQDHATITNPSVTNILYGAPLWDVYGPAQDYNAGLNKGTQAATFNVTGVFQ